MATETLNQNGGKVETNKASTSKPRCGQDFPISPRDLITVPKNSTFSGTACLGCGAASDNPMTQRLWQPSEVYFFGRYGTPIQLVRTAFTKRTSISYPMCGRCSRRGPKRVRIGSILILLSALLIAIGLTSTDGSFSAALQLPGHLLLLTGLLTVVTRPFFFRCTEIDKKYATVRRNPSWRVPK
jgi:hypothetical protein